MADRNVILGLDCALFYCQSRDHLANSEAARNAITTRAQWEAIPWDSGDWVEVESVRDVTLNLTTSLADLTTRAARGWRQQVAALKDASVDFKLLWQPDDAVFSLLLTAFLQQCPSAFLISDTRFVNPLPSSSWQPVSGRCSETGDATALFADFAISNFTRTETLEEGVMADVTIVPTVSVSSVDNEMIYPEWISFTYS